jgi:hypothetical protein
VRWIQTPTNGVAAMGVVARDEVHAVGEQPLPVRQLIRLGLGVEPAERVELAIDVLPEDRERRTARGTEPVAVASQRSELDVLVVPIHEERTTVGEARLDPADERLAGRRAGKRDRVGRQRQDRAGQRMADQVAGIFERTLDRLVSLSVLDALDGLVHEVRWAGSVSFDEADLGQQVLVLDQSARLAKAETLASASRWPGLPQLQSQSDRSSGSCRRASLTIASDALSTTIWPISPATPSSLSMRTALVKAVNHFGSYCWTPGVPGLHGEHSSVSRRSLLVSGDRRSHASRRRSCAISAPDAEALPTYTDGRHSRASSVAA